MPQRRKLLILGSTGSIGTQALEVVAHVNELAKAGRSPIEFEVVGLAAGKNARLLAEQARRFGVRDLALAGASGCGESETNGDVRGDVGNDAWPARSIVRRGANSAEQLVCEVPCDLVLAAMVGSAGVPATLAAVECGRPLALANKETLVAAGALVMPRARKQGTSVLPVDSEHAALWQCLLAGHSSRDAASDERSPGASTKVDPLRSAMLEEIDSPLVDDSRVRKAILTASGGAFRTWTQDQIEQATPEDALKHPTWNMGAKVTIDCAGLMNKGLELIEAHWLFGLPASKLDVLVHPQSIVHAIAEFMDGSSVAQLAPPDMRLPIQRALAWPFMIDGVSRRMNWSEMRTLEFSPPDLARFPALGLAYKVLELGGTSGATLNGANEEAVAAFLARKIGFGAIARVVEASLHDLRVQPLHSLDDVWRAEGEAREYVRTWVGRHAQ
jgi:1-deoxy-D-xylulose-5-phosphate reductoisomerase